MAGTVSRCYNRRRYVSRLTPEQKQLIRERKRESQREKLKDEDYRRKFNERRVEINRAWFEHPEFRSIEGYFRWLGAKKNTFAEEDE